MTPAFMSPSPLQRVIYAVPCKSGEWQFACIKFSWTLPTRAIKDPWQSERFVVRGEEVRNMKRFHRFYALLALLLVASLMAPAAFGQSLVSGDLTGTVTDPTGAVLANTTVTLKSDATGETRTSVRVPIETRRTLMRTSIAAIKRDPDAVAAGFDALGLIIPGTPHETVRWLAELLIATAYSRTTTRERIDALLADRVMKTLFDFPIVLPQNLVYFGRTAALIEGVGTRYDPYFQAG